MLSLLVKDVQAVHLSHEKKGKMTMRYLLTVMVLMVLVGCGGSVEVTDGQTDLPQGGSAGAAGVGTGGSSLGGAGGSSKAGSGGLPIGGSAGSPTGGSAGQPDAGDAGCSPELNVELMMHYSPTACPGMVAILTLIFNMTATCQDMEIGTMAFQLVSLDFDSEDTAPFCKGSCTSVSDWYFHNIKLVNTTGQTLMGPVELKPYAVNAPAYISFTDSIQLKAGMPVVAIVQLDVADSFASPLPKTRYAVHFNFADTGNGNIPLIVKNEVDPQAAFTVTQACN